jgi:secreted PhoX family phosphatase
MTEELKGGEDSNRSANPIIHEVSDAARRIVLRNSLAATLSAVFGPAAMLAVGGCAAARPGGGGIGFKGIPASAADALVVPEGYRAEVLYRWGDPVGIAGDMPAFRPDAGDTMRRLRLCHLGGGPVAVAVGVQHAFVGVFVVHHQEGTRTSRRFPQRIEMHAIVMHGGLHRLVGRAIAVADQ